MIILITSVTKHGIEVVKSGNQGLHCISRLALSISGAFTETLMQLCRLWNWGRWDKYHYKLFEIPAGYSISRYKQINTR